MPVYELTYEISSEKKKYNLCKELCYILHQNKSASFFFFFSFFLKPLVLLHSI